MPILEEQRRQAAERKRRRELYRNPPDIEHAWLDTAEVAALCQLSRKWVIKQIRLERMPATSHGGQWWVRREHAEVVAAARAFARRADKMQDPGQDASA
ncbi:helix-turn-helix domain-containing protein [Nocardioides lentus]|uniref:helix-turn-helix domain-containing protein n=1 Tax=Nocardioides lentus TaxID=338077 RepID=UPI003CD0A546